MTINTINKVKVSVIVPVLNGERTLAKCLDSLLNQNFIDYEIIVVDNNSNDRTKNIITDFKNKFAKIFYVFEPKRGRGSARNAGVVAARGDIIAMIDADCIAPSDWLTRICAPILEGKELAVAGFEDDAVKNYWSKMRQESNWQFAQSRTVDGYIGYLDTKNFAIRADIVKRFGFDSSLTALEDWGLYINLKKEGIKIKFLADLVVLHYHDASLSALFRTQFGRGKSAAYIIKSHRHDQKFQELFNEDEGVDSMRLWNFAVFIPWAIWQFISNTKMAPYKVIDDLAWKCGIIAAFIDRHR